MLTKERITELRATTTPGPWTIENIHPADWTGQHKYLINGKIPGRIHPNLFQSVVVCSGEHQDWMTRDDYTPKMLAANMELIAMSRELLDAVETLTAALEQVAWSNFQLKEDHIAARDALAKVYGDK